MKPDAIAVELTARSAPPARSNLRPRFIVIGRGGGGVFGGIAIITKNPGDDRRQKHQRGRGQDPLPKHGFKLPQLSSKESDALQLLALAHILDLPRFGGRLRA